MTRYILMAILFCAFTFNADAQFKNLLKKAEERINKEISGNQPESQSTSQAEKPHRALPEPDCACELNAEKAVDLSAFKFEYTEHDIHTLSDGSIVMYNNYNYYLLKNGALEGPIDKKNPRYSEIEGSYNKKEEIKLPTKGEYYKDYISEVNEKYIIKFQGKTYGPYAKIDTFVMNQSKDKFMARVYEHTLFTEKETKKFYEDIQNAKTDDERREISMKMAMQTSERQKKGETQSKDFTIVTNIPMTKAEKDAVSKQAYWISTTAKYDEFIMYEGSKIYDTHGKLIYDFDAKNEISPGLSFLTNMFYLSTDNSKWAMVIGDNITFNDMKSITGLLDARYARIDGKNYLTYLYVSPKNNAIMRCKIPF